MRQVVVTGASSSIGLAFIDLCIKNNVSVTALARLSSPRSQRIPKHPLVRVVDFSLGNSIDIEAKGAVFYHLAWEGTNRLDRIDPGVQTKNITSTLDLIDAAYRAGCCNFIGTGSQAEYGRVDGLITPESPCNPDTAYGAAKYAAGKLGGLQAKKLGLPFIWARIFSVYGGWDPEYTMLMSLINNMRQGKEMPLTPCGQIWDFLYAEDAARALFLLGQKGKSRQIYHIAHGDTRPLRDYIEDIKTCIPRPELLKIGALPYPPMQVMNLRPDISDLAKDTGFVPQVTFKEGFQRMLHQIQMRELDEKN